MKMVVYDAELLWYFDGFTIENPEEYFTYVIAEVILPLSRLIPSSKKVVESQTGRYHDRMYASSPEKICSSKVKNIIGYLLYRSRHWNIDLLLR